MYKLFQQSYIDKPTSYRLGKDNTLRDVIILLAKQHYIVLDGVTIQLQNKHYSTVEYSTISANVRVVDIIYVIDKLLNNGYKLIEDSLTLLTIPVDTQAMIYRAAKSTGKLHTATKSTTKATNTYIQELCKEPINMAEIRQYLLADKNNSVEASTYSIRDNTVVRGSIYLGHSRTYNGVDVYKFHIFATETDIATDDSIDSVDNEEYGPLDTFLPLFYKDIEEIYYSKQILILGRRTQCLSTTNYAKEYVAKKIEHNWANTPHTVEGWISFYYRGLLSQFFDEEFGIDTNPTSAQAKIMVLAAQTNNEINMSADTIFEQPLQQYVDLVLRYLRL